MVDLIALMGTLVDNRGKIQIPGIYDTVAQVTPEEKELYKPIDFDPVCIVIIIQFISQRHIFLRIFLCSFYQALDY